MRSNAKRKGYQSGGYVGGDPYGGPGPDDVAGVDPYTAQSLARLLPLAAANQGTPPAPQRARQEHIRIAPPPMSANASRVMQQLMSQQTPNWGSALSKLASVAITGHLDKKRGAARQAAETTKREQRARWAGELGSGASMRDLAMADPDFLADTEFVKGWQSTAPAPEAERFDFADNPFGRGGHGQRSSLTGRVHDWQGPVADAEEFGTVSDPFGFGGAAQRSSTTGKLSGYQGAPTSAKETTRATATDQHGRLRYLDDGSPAFSDEVLGGGQAPEAPLKDRLGMVRDLSDDWQKTVRPMQGLIDQSTRMDIGFSQAERGDMLSGSQAILISFNKLLDPTSVVRESEYARSATGQSALETMRGFVDKLGKGGAGVTIRELQTYRDFGQEVVKQALESTLRPERERISRLVEFAGVDPELIFTGRFASDAAPQQEAQEQPQVAPRQQAAPPMYQGPSPTAPRSPEAFQADPRASHYAGLDKAQLRRQAATMQAEPGQYNDAERRAMGHAWRQKFGE